MGHPILLFGASAADRTWIRTCLGDDAVLLTACTLAEARHVIAGRQLACAIVCSGSEAASAELAGIGQCPLLLCSDAPLAGAAAGVWYVIQRRLPAPLVRSLIAAASGARVEAPLVREPLAARQRALLDEAARRLDGQRDLAGVERVCAAVVSELLRVARAECLFFDAESGALWSETREAGLRLERRAVGGLIGYAARRGTLVNVPVLSADPRWLEELEGGEANQRLLAVPVVGRDQVHALLVAWRDAREPAFAAADEALLAGFAERAAPLLDQRSLELEASEVAAGANNQGLFRAEALRSQRRYGSVLRVPPESTWPYLALAALLGCAGGLSLCITPSHLNADGSAAPGGNPNWVRRLSSSLCESIAFSVCRGPSRERSAGPP